MVPCMTGFAATLTRRADRDEERNEGSNAGTYAGKVGPLR